MAIHQLALLGDSLTQGSAGAGTFGAGGFNLSSGGAGSWADIVADKLAAIQSLGPLLSSGFRGAWLGSVIASPWVNGTLEWGFSPAPLSGGDGWTTVVSTDAYDKCPYGTAAGVTPTAGSTNISMWNSGSTKIMTWTKPPHWRNIVGFAVYWVNITGGGNWSYSVDNNATWTNMGQNISSPDNSLNKFYVNTAMDTNVRFRAANSAGTAAKMLIVGVEVFYSTSTNGLIVHNLALNGSELDQIVPGGGGASTAGDRLAFLDSVVLGTGSPITNVPDLGVVVMHINDVLLTNSTQFGVNLTNLNTRVRASDGSGSPLGPLSIMIPWECSTGTYDVTQQGLYAFQALTIAASLGLQCFNIRSEWRQAGWNGNAGAVAQGFLLPDAVHESQAGHFDLGNRLYTFIKGALPAPFNTIHNTASNTGSSSVRTSSGMSSSGTAW